MNSSFFYSTFIFIIISIVFIIFCFSSTITTLSYNNEIAFSNGSIILPEDIYFSNSKFSWPTPRTYNYNFIFWL